LIRGQWALDGAGSALKTFFQSIATRCLQEFNKIKIRFNPHSFSHGSFSIGDLFFINQPTPLPSFLQASKMVSGHVYTMAGNLCHQRIVCT